MPVLENNAVLRIHAIHGAKTTKNQTPLYVLLDYFERRSDCKIIKQIVPGGGLIFSGCSTMYSEYPQ